MQEMLNKLYEIDNFTTYLSIALAVLVILFILILFLGKKDQKLEETKRLQKIEMDAFKNESEVTKIEVAKASSEAQNKIEEVVKKEEPKAIEKEEVVFEEAPITLSELDNIELPKKKEESIIPEVNTIIEKEVVDKPSDASDDFEDLISKIDENRTQDVDDTKKSVEEEITIPTETYEPLLEEVKIPELVVDELPISAAEDNVANAISNENITIPDFDFTEVIEEIKNDNDEKEEVKKEEIIKEEAPKKTFGTPVFSSVFVPKKEEEVKEEVEDDVIDLTNLGVKEEKNLENTASFVDLTGETYDINNK